MTNHRPGEIDATKCGVAYCEHHREGLPYCVECREESTLAHDKACALLAEARADADHWKSECNALQRMVHEAQAEIERDELKKQLAEARAEIERLALEIENKQYTITCASEENQQLKESLAEARAEIERLKLVSQNQETVIAAQRRSAKAKNELIEQMREALRLTADEYSLHVSRYENRNAHDDPCYIAAEQALAAERGEL